jgi:hypothetical protein
MWLLHDVAVRIEVARGVLCVPPLLHLSNWEASLSLQDLSLSGWSERGGRAARALP